MLLRKRINVIYFYFCEECEYIKRQEIQSITRRVSTFEGEFKLEGEGESSNHYHDFVPAKELFRWLGRSTYSNLEGVRVRVSKATMMLRFHLRYEDHQMVSFQYSYNQNKVLYCYPEG
jgi:hypothetical protein